MTRITIIIEPDNGPQWNTGANLGKKVDPAEAAHLVDQLMQAAKHQLQVLGVIEKI